MKELIDKYKIDEVCDTHFKKFKGLMFSRKKNLLFDLGKEGRFSAIVHMFFVFYPIQVYWFDKDMNLVDEKKLMPFTIGIPKMKARYIVEIG